MSQILLLKELVIVFYGNELTWGIMLGSWLLGTALGSSISGNLLKKRAASFNIFILMMFVFAALLPVTICFIRMSPNLWGLQQGEISSIAPVVLIPLLSLLPICMLAGSIYSYSCKLHAHFSAKTAESISKIYLWESIGGGTASLVFSIFFLNHLNSFTISLILNLFLMLTIFLIIQISGRKQALLIALITLFTICFVYAHPRLNELSLNQAWGRYEVLENKNSIYGNITVTKWEENINFYENGSLVFSYPDRLYAEEAVHFTMLEHPNPENILLIGGGLNGSLQQILTHPTVNFVDYIELDPVLVSLAKKHLPTEPTSAIANPRVKLHTVDGRLFVKQTSRKYDVIIVNLPDPHTTQLNRFYTMEFFRETHSLLQKNGIIGFSVTSSENVIGEDLANFLKCLYNSLQTVFADIVIIPGDTNHFIASATTAMLTTNPDTLVSRLIKRNLPTVYLREYYLPFRLSKDRMAYIHDRIIQNKTTSINRDFEPVGNFHHLILWTTYFNQWTRSVFLYLHQINFALFFGACLLLILPFFIFKYIRRSSDTVFNYGIFASISIIGFSEMAFEIILILAFQAIYGYAYYQLAIILSGFMIGLAAGSYYTIRIRKTRIRDMFRFRCVQLGMVLYPLLLLGALKLLHAYLMHVIVIQTLFMILTLTAGFIAGSQYPLASNLYVTDRQRSPGKIYAWDLFGACIGAFLTSTILIPIMGIEQAIIGIMLLNLSVFLILLPIKPAIGSVQ